MRYLLFLAFFIQSLSATDEAAPALQTESAKENLRMGFNNGKYSLSILFPKELTLEYKITDDGHQTYYSNAHGNGRHIAYNFGCYGYGLQGLATFKDSYIESIKAEFHKINPLAKSFVTLNEKGDRIRATVDHICPSGKRAVFVGDFLSIDSKVYLISEIIISDNETGSALSIIDNTFFESFTLEKR